LKKLKIYKHEIIYFNNHIKHMSLVITKEKKKRYKEKTWITYCSFSRCFYPKQRTSKEQIRGAIWGLCQLFSKECCFWGLNQYSSLKDAHSSSCATSAPCKCAIWWALTAWACETVGPQCQPQAKLMLVGSAGSDGVKGQFMLA